MSQESIKNAGRQRSIATRATPRVDRLPPHSIEAEQAVLGACLSDPKTCVPLMAAVLKGAESFYDVRHQRLASGLIRMFDAGKHIDLVTVCDALFKNDKAKEEVGGLAYVATLQDMGMECAIAEYMAIVKDKHLKRRTVQLCMEAVQRIMDGEEGLAAIEALEQGVLDVNRSRVLQADTVWRDVIYKALDRMDDYQRGKGQMLGIATGFDYLDKMLCGVKPKEFIIIAGRPGTGKTSLAFNFVEEIAIRASVPTGVFSLEMSGDELGARSIFQFAREDFQRFRTGFMRNESVPELIEAAHKVAEAPIFLDERADTTIADIRAKARRWVSEHGIRLLVIDYVGLVRGTKNYRERRDEVGEVSRGLKACAKELGIPVVAACQLNRESEKNPGRIPQLSDLRECGDLEQDADVVGILHRPKLTDDEKQAKAKRCDWAAHSERINLHICKQRNGPTGKVELLFQKDCMRFSSYKRAKVQEEQEALE